MPLSSRHLLGLRGMPREDIQQILDTAVSFREVLERPIKKVPTLQGKTVVNLFFESSTRTRISFDLAERRLSADVVQFASDTSSVKKGETLRDTARNLEAMKIDMVVVRHSAAGVPKLLSEVLNVNVVNAGDGAHEHPTQALLDMYTLRERFGSLEGLKVCILGDITHSRVARSNIHGLLTMGAKVSVCGPRTLIPMGIGQMGVTVHHDLDDAVKDADAINVLRIQLERMEKACFPSIREYHNLYGLTAERLAKAKQSAVVLHPGPINRDVELSADVADGDRSLILRQVLNGVAVRMAALYLIGTGS
ncbi:MAG TPA: aspartate carbamoyltransferase catalytic subunit [Bacteroidota bacterium]|nr:aspartate carbamoyltransferase catalytic subunit [Bacteroidota bacterium]